MAALSLLLIAVTLPQAAQASDPYQRALRIEENYRGKAFRTRVVPNWLPGDALWYRVETGPNEFEWVWSDAAGAVKRFKSQEALQKALGSAAVPSEPLRLSDRPAPGEAGERVDLVFENKTDGEISLFWVNGEERVPYAKVPVGGRVTQSTFAGHVWEVRKADGSVLGYVTAPALGGAVTVDGQRAARSQEPRQAPGNGKWTAFVRDHNLWIKAQGAEATRATEDGSAADSFNGTGMFWSPDGKKLVVFRTVPAQERKVHLVSSSPRDQLQPRLITLDYLKPGDKIAQSRPVLVSLESGRVAPIDKSLFSNPWSLPPLGPSGWGNGVTWSADSSRFFFAYNERGHRLMRVIAVNAADGTPRTLFEDPADTFIHYSGKFWSRYVPESDEILWMSERDGWNHLYAHDASTGSLKRQLTKGEWVVRGVESVNPSGSEMILRVAGRTAGEDPYHVHYARLDVRSGKLTPLTEGDGTHRLTFGPEGKTYLDTYSRVDTPPVTELRRVSDGKLLARLETADIARLEAAGWPKPERFVAKGRDGKTDIWGVVWRPSRFDPKAKYPVIEQIYAGPQGFFVPKAWSATFGNAQQLSELGFIVVQIDGMGTDGRSKAFHDVASKNLKDAGFPDRITWMRALAKKIPSMDLTRVGVYGGSAGGQNAMAALLWHGDFYKAAAADCGCHDNRMDKVWWNEQWMGYPVDASYEASSNVVHAGRLTGKLLLTVGELDTNVDPASTMQVADALIRAGKEFELIVFPGGGHGAGDSAYGKRRRMEFFVRHLRGGVAD